MPSSKERAALPMQDEWTILELLFSCPVYLGEVVRAKYPDGLMTEDNITGLADWVRVQNLTDGAWRVTRPLTSMGQRELPFDGDGRGSAVYRPQRSIEQTLAESRRLTTREMNARMRKVPHG